MANVLSLCRFDSCPVLLVLFSYAMKTYLLTIIRGALGVVKIYIETVLIFLFMSWYNPSSFQETVWLVVALVLILSSVSVLVGKIIHKRFCSKPSVYPYTETALNTRPIPK
jgi:hypothetical protein